MTRSARAARRWFSTAAEADFAPAQHAIALMYRDGEGGSKSTARALHWAKQAADQGHDAAAEVVTELSQE